MTTQNQDLEQAAEMSDPAVPVDPELKLEKAKVRRPSFRQEPNLSPSDLSPDLGSDDSSADAGGFPEPSEQMPDEPSSKSGSSPTSSRADKAALRKAAAVGFAGATTGAHEFLVRDPYAKATGLLLADEQDVQAVSTPAGNLLARRMGDVPLGSDLGDVIELIVAGAGYVLKQLGKLRLARQLRAEGAAINGHQPDLGDQLDPGAFDVPLAD